jgi:hypothetical protein
MAFDFDAPKDTESRIIRATADELLESGYDVLSRGIRPEIIAKRVGCTRKTVYTVGTKQELLDRLSTTYLDPARTGRTAELSSDLLERMLQTTATADQAAIVLDLSNRYFGDVFDTHIPDVQIMLWAAAHSSSGVRAKFDDLYSTLTTETSTLFEALFQLWDRKARPPFSTRSLAAVAMALIEGLVLQHRISRDETLRELPGIVLAALYLSATQPTNEPDRPLVDSFASALSRSSPPAGRTRSSRRMLQESALAVVLGHWEEISMASDLEALRRIEDEVQVPQASALIGDWEQLIADAVEDHVSVLTVDGPDLTDLVARLHNLIRDEPDLVRCFVWLCSRPSPHGSVTAVAERIGSAIADQLPSSPLHDWAALVSVTVLRWLADGLGPEATLVALSGTSGGQEGQGATASER